MILLTQVASPVSPTTNKGANEKRSWNMAGNEWIVMWGKHNLIMESNNFQGNNLMKTHCRAIKPIASQSIRKRKMQGKESREERSDKCRLSRNKSRKTLTLRSPMMRETLIIRRTQLTASTTSRNAFGGWRRIWRTESTDIRSKQD